LYPSAAYFDLKICGPITPPNWPTPDCKPIANAVPVVPLSEDVRHAQNGMARQAENIVPNTQAAYIAPRARLAKKIAKVIISNATMTSVKTGRGNHARFSIYAATIIAIIPAAEGGIMSN
jgi:hypothetical protein